MKIRKIRCWQCNSLLTKNGECTNIGCMPSSNWRYEINYDMAPENLKQYLLKKNYNKAEAEEVKQELLFQLSSCKREEQILKALNGFCRKYNIPFIAFAHYSYRRKRKYY
ncbi:MAG: hypothetical protein UHN47_07160 [Lachnospiraceae bacterium]|nr:hypothetical protein [Lachnospiraceae bacterium]